MLGTSPTVFLLYLPHGLPFPFPYALLAYIDPGSGGVLFYWLTFIVSALSGAIMLFSRQIRVILARVRRFLRSKLGGRG